MFAEPIGIEPNTNTKSSAMRLIHRRTKIFDILPLKLKHCVCLTGDNIKNMKTTLCFIIVFCAVAIGAAQERVIDKTDFDRVVADGNKSLARLKNERYRMTITTSAKIVGRPQSDWSSKSISEYVAADQTRNVHSSMFGGKANPTRELIVLGKWKYARSGTESWTRTAYEPGQTPAQPAAPPPPPDSPYEEIATTADYKYLGKVDLGRRTANAYQRIERQTKVNKKNGENTESVSKATYWFAEDGSMLKNENQFESRAASMTTNNFVSVEWTVDPALVITEPIVTPAKP
jgi:hypothetical protein